MFAALLVGFIPDRLDEILDDPKLAGAIVAASVASIDGTTLYSRNESLHVVPASNQKMLTCTFALQTLGEDYRPKTRIWKEPTRTFIDSDGDPLLTHGELMWAKNRLGLNPSLPVWVRQPHAPGIPPTWEHDDLPNKYAAPITAFTVDRGSFELWFKDGKIQALPSAHGVTITRGRTDGALSVAYDPFAKHLLVHGKLPTQDQRLDTLAIARPDEAAALLLGSRFVPTTQAPPSREPDLTLMGRPMSEIIGRCLKPSDNNVAENLLLLAAGKAGPLPANPYPVAAERMAKFLTSAVGIAKQDVRPYDGSGMSRHNFVTSRALVKLLAWNAKQPAGDLWKSSLAESGQPGTMANRLKNIRFYGKTGTLDMVTALSGYVRHRSGEDLVVSIVLNQYGCSPSDARDLMDRFVTEVATAELPFRAGRASAENQGIQTTYESSHPHGDRVHRSSQHRLAARERHGRRAEPRHEASHRAERVAVRVR